jgi:hypothetical protein
VRPVGVVHHVRRGDEERAAGLLPGDEPAAQRAAGLDREDAPQDALGERRDARALLREPSLGQVDALREPGVRPPDVLHLTAQRGDLRA